MLKRPRKETDWFLNYKDYNRHYVDKNFFQNRILTNNVMLSLDTEKTKRNNNVFVLANNNDADNYILSNILQANTNYIIPDVGGKFYQKTKNFFQQNGYSIQVFNLCNPNESICYNPFKHFILENGNYKDSIDKTIMSLFKNDTQLQEINEKCLLLALINYIINNMSAEYHSFSNVLDLLYLIDFEQENVLENLDELFDNVDKNSIIWKYYKIFKTSSGTNIKQVVLSLSEKLSAFKKDAIKNITNTDTLLFKEFAENKNVLFVILPEKDQSYYPIVNMLFSQIIEDLYRKEHFKHPTMIFVDSIQLTSLEDLHKYNQHGIQLSIICHSLTDLQHQYIEKWDYFIANCDSFLYMSGKNQNDFQYVSQMLGKKSALSKKNIQTRILNCYVFDNLMSVKEVEQLPPNKNILIIRGLKPFMSEKYQLNKHPNFQQLII